MKHSRATNTFLFVLVLLFAFSAHAQTRNFHVLLRTMKTNIPTKETAKSCVIVQDNGQYRYEELPGFGMPTPQNSKVYVGNLSPELKKQLDSLVDKKDLISLGTVKPAHWKMRVQQSMELVSLNVRRGGASEQELNYFVADSKGAIPPPVQAFVPWAQSLKRQLGAPVKDAQPDMCKVAAAATTAH
ncbi:MAG TPA: hypothetical protein VFP40_13530 [Terriglobales bacterium]|nr:hypothetical protein [Terriglobales bacterium]